MKKILTLLFLFVAVIANAAKYYKSKIEFIDGSTKEGYAELPSNSMFDGAIKFRISKKEKSIRYDFDTIEYILYYTDSGRKHIFERKNIKSIYGSKKKPREHNFKSKYWSLLRFSDPVIKCYQTGENYYIDGEGEITVTIKNNIGLASTSICFLRPDEEILTMITTGDIKGANVLGRESKFRKSAAHYFKDVPELVERIRDKEFKAENIEELLKTYVAYKNGQNSKE
ncbi:hypothetical protein DVK85_03380 [Flavobacterium arcticum]|uniref:GLPGLI family protein n=1 Tax=Flavobacterium arcticum TaxID=1784713 RepID=A0A345H9R1_9FLAO|nr:hypothetical protein [Flavobacterium arcticum]AXG73321.1 hypothetical protein DVK85_03380 [Flavobacterium arcticum]KAF2513116.1 hypothetical protein E0W72_01445 [Flavobacterium arcticum]